MAHVVREVSEVRQAGAPEPPLWTARVLRIGGAAATAHARNHVFPVGPSVSFRPQDAHPSATEYLLGALGGDLVNAFTRAASRRGIPLDALEASVSGRLNNPLVALGVVGETGHPGFEQISCTLYVSADAEDSTLEEIWQAALAASPLVHTLQRGVTLSLKMHLVV